MSQTFFTDKNRDASDSKLWIKTEHQYSGFTHWKLWFSIVFCMFTRGYLFVDNIHHKNFFHASPWPGHPGPRCCGHAMLRRPTAAPNTPRSALLRGRAARDAWAAARRSRLVAASNRVTWWMMCRMGGKRGGDTAKVEFWFGFLGVKASHHCWVMLNAHFWKMQTWAGIVQQWGMVPG